MSDEDVQQQSHATDTPYGESYKTSGASEAEAFLKNKVDEEDRRFQQKMRQRRKLEEMKEEYEQLRSERMWRKLYANAIIFCLFMVLVYVSMINPSIYVIDKATLIIVNQALNAAILLLVPFFLGMIGAVARIMIATINPDHKSNLLISSGLMATFSWIGIKSGVLISIIAPHLERTNITAEQVADTSHNFYTMALVAVLVGMFSTNLYLIIADKVDQITRQRNSSPAE